MRIQFRRTKIPQSLKDEGRISVHIYSPSELRKILDINENDVIILTENKEFDAFDLFINNECWGGSHPFDEENPRRASSK